MVTTRCVRVEKFVVTYYSIIYMCVWVRMCVCVWWMWWWCWEGWAEVCMQFILQCCPGNVFVYWYIKTRAQIIWHPSICELWLSIVKETLHSFLAIIMAKQVWCFCVISQPSCWSASAGCGWGAVGLRSVWFLPAYQLAGGPATVAAWLTTLPRTPVH